MTPQWRIIVPPVRYDREIQRPAVDDTIPEGQWHVIGRAYFEFEGCEEERGLLADRAARSALADPSRAKRMVADGTGLARCVRLTHELTLPELAHH